jgi:hypothetical protein
LKKAEHKTVNVIQHQEEVANYHPWLATSGRVLALLYF